MIFPVMVQGISFIPQSIRKWNHRIRTQSIIQTIFKKLLGIIYVLDVYHQSASDMDEEENDINIQEKRLRHVVDQTRVPNHR